MRNIEWGLFLVVVFFALAGCSSGKDSGGGINAPVSDQTPGISADEADSNCLTISKDSLGEEYLLQTSITYEEDYGTYLWNPTSKGQKSRIVTFQEHDGDLLMIESSEGLQPGDELDSTILLTTFPIVSEDENSITFNFNDGMRFYINSWDWYGSDFGTSIERRPVKFADSSFIKSIEEDGDATTITQVMSSIEGGDLVPVKLTYYLTKYAPDRNFTPVVSPGFDYLGFFEANPIVQNDFGNAFTYITKWNISKPITYYLSSDIPEEYREAVKEGVLYWNKAFGREVMHVEMAPDDVDAPSFKYNIVQWHTAHYRGSAYADVLVDPRTGEILHSQIYISSGMVAWDAAWYLDYIDRQLSDEETGSPGAFEEADSSSAFSPEQFVNGAYVYSDVMNSLPAKRKREIVNDILRWAVAHEVGHTLGLRHNFAASTFGELSGSETDKILRDYMRNGDLPEGLAYPADSVMDYPTIEELILVGALMARPEAEALPYDKYAIQWAYFGSAEKPDYQDLPFCTDSQVGFYSDCRKGDGGKHMIERRAYMGRRALENIPRLLSEIYLESKADFDKMGRKPVNESTPTAAQLASSVAFEWFELLKLLDYNVNLRSIIVNYPDRTEADSDSIDSQVVDWMGSEISFAGGIDEVFRLIDPDYYSKTVDGFDEKFKEIISADEFQNVKLPEGGTATFSGEDIDYMKSRADELFPEVDEKLVSYIDSIIAGASFKLLDVAEAEEAKIATWVEYVLTAFKDSDFRYSVGTRQKLLMILAKPGPLPDWLKSYIPNMADRLKARLEEKYGMSVGDIDPKSFPRREQAAVAADLNIYIRLVNMSAGAPIPEPLAPASSPAKEDVGAVGWIGKLIN